MRVASCRVATSTIRKLSSKLMSEKCISIGLLPYLKPFYITSPLDKKKVMCVNYVWTFVLNLTLSWLIQKIWMVYLLILHMSYASVLKVRMVTGIWNVLKESAKIVVTLNHLKFQIWKMKSCITMSLWLKCLLCEQKK